MNEAIKAAMAAKKVDLLVSPEAVLARENNVDISDAVVTELNRILPSVSTAPPAGYQPGQLVQQRNQAAMNAARAQQGAAAAPRSEEHTSELQSLMRSSYAVFCLKKKKTNNKQN